MRILLTNDDGIHAPGIHALWNVFDGWADLFVVAPEGERSATGHGITVHEPIRVEKLQFSNPHFHGWAVKGTPADCVKLALEELMQEPPDIVISGINRGPNLATDVLYSGTVSAAMEGMIYGFPSMAVSIASWKDCDYDYAAKVTKEICIKITEKGLTPDTLLNVNIPDLPEEKIQGIKVTKLGNRRYQNIFDKRVDPRGRTYYWMAGEVKDIDYSEGTDIGAIKEGYISVTPIHFDLTNYPILEGVRGWFNKSE
ncbi:5'/3'-nucleotidase SurE [Heliorestis convoluta]|uniref:5'/3'-nucleotidase SurE n=1 Tax=Heliorestis convoluta TaxID=356322 RepID=UPI00129AF9B6|nr:5'/3'-nucleotidase SurE [Heliorestis convoluta]